MDLLPYWYQLTIVATLGLVIGSFLNVVIYRFHTGRSLSGSSHCMSCGTKLLWFELFPLLSYIFLRGSCRTCKCHIPVRYFLVELILSLVFVCVYQIFGLSVLGIFSLVLMALLMVITVYDLYHMIIPDKLVILTTFAAVLYFGITNYEYFQLTQLLESVSAALIGFIFYGGLWLFSKGRWIGLGDAKLAVPLSFMLGPLGTFSFIVLSFWVGAAVSILILAVPYIKQTVIRLVYTLKSDSKVVADQYPKHFTMKSEVPFAPFMVIAFLLVYLFEVNVLELMAAFI